MAARWGLLLVAAWLALAALGAASDDMQPSALRVMVTAVTGLLAPLFWPGVAATPARTALRVVTWSVAVALLAAAALRVLGHAMQPIPKIISSCLMLLLILLVTHALAAALEAWLRRLSLADDVARETAGGTLAIALALAGALPLWLGPFSELLSARQAWVIDAVVAVSPLTHLAVASENDLMRNQWFYQHSNLASLSFSYPGLAGLTWGYASVSFVLVLMLPALRVLRRPLSGATRAGPTQEKTK